MLQVVPLDVYQLETIVEIYIDTMVISLKDYCQQLFLIFIALEWRNCL